MTCFIQESPLDFLLYYPIIKILEERKLEYVVYDAKNKSIVDTIQFFSQNPPSRVINYGGSHHKLQVALLCKEYKFPFVNLHGNERMGERDSTKFLDTISHLAYQNYVVSDLARTFLLEEGIQTPIGVFECPITNLARKSVVSDELDVVYISENIDKLQKQQYELSKHRYKLRIYDYSDGNPENWKQLYSDLRNTKYIVSDCFMFDKPARFLNKHFFYIGSDILEYTNLGISTHLVSKKLELHDYFKQSWSELTDINPKLGLQSLLQTL